MRTQTRTPTPSRGESVSRRASRQAHALVASGLVLASLVSCSEGAPPPAPVVPGDTGAGQSVCASAIEGCGCRVEGQTQECFPDPLIENGAHVCLVGERTCRDGTWSACEDVHRLVGEDGRDVVVQAASDDPFACSPCEPLCFQARDFIEGDQDIRERGGNGIVFNPGRGGAENVGRVTECRDASCGTRSAVGVGSMNPWNPTPDNSDGVVVDPSDGALVLGVLGLNSPGVWVANMDDGTVSRLDPRSGREIGRYVTARPSAANGARPATENCNWSNIGNCPSRTAIDQNFDCYVANRAFGNQGTVSKIAADLRRCIDRNANGRIDTATDRNGDGRISMSDPTEFYGVNDECILWTVPVGVRNGVPRALSVGVAGSGVEVGDIWVGNYNEARAYRLRPSDGATLGSVSLCQSAGGRTVGVAGGLSIGWDGWYDTRGTGFALDNLRVYRRALSPEEIVADRDGAAPASASALLADWRFEDDVNDSSGNGYHFTSNSGTFVAGRHGRAVRFSGTQRALTPAYSPGFIWGESNTPYTISYWINAGPPTGGWRNILRKRPGVSDCCGAGDRTPSHWLWPGEMRVHVTHGTEADGNSSHHPYLTGSDVWVHVAETHDPTTGIKTAYINGTLATTRFTGNASCNYPYGNAVDSRGRVFFWPRMGGTTRQFGYVTPSTSTFTFTADSPYYQPIGYGMTYYSNADGSQEYFYVADSDNGYVLRYNVLANNWIYAATPGNGAPRGMAADVNGNVYAAGWSNSVGWGGGCNNRLWRWDTNLANFQQWTAPSASCFMGVGVTLDNAVWLIGAGGSRGARLAPDRSSWVESPSVFVNPYTYSDFIGYGLLVFANPRGNYSFVTDAGEGCEQRWQTAEWASTVPVGTSVEIFVRSANTQAGLNSASWIGPFITSPANLTMAPGPVPNGRFLEMDIRMATTDRRLTPRVRSASASGFCDRTFYDTGGTYTRMYDSTATEDTATPRVICDPLTDLTIWGDFTWSAEIPERTSITFEFRAGNSPTTARMATPVTFNATNLTPPVINLSNLFVMAGRPGSEVQAPYMEVRAVLNSSTDRLRTPTLRSFLLEFNCMPGS
jgi:hypothetical protein